MKTYEIGGHKYIQPPVVLGQINLLLPLLSGIEITAATNPVGLVVSLGVKLPEALAVVLVEEGTELKQAMKPEALSERREVLSWSLSPEAALEAVTDFFEVNPISSIGARIGEAMSGMRAKLRETSLSVPSSMPAAETSPGATMSSGECPQAPSSDGCAYGPNGSGTISSGS